MALYFAARIHALTGFDADSTGDTETGQDFDEHTAQWMTEAAKEVINILPTKLKQKCTTITALANDTPMDLDSIGEILYVTRKNDDSGYHVPCREISPIYGSLAEDPNSMHYAKDNDPVYWVTSNASDVPKLFIKPDPSSTQGANVYHVFYPIFTAGDTETYDVSQKTIIENFPDEAENLVVLRAAILAAEYQMAAEQDMEVYATIVSNLKQEYQQGILALQTGSVVPPQQQGAR